MWCTNFSGSYRVDSAEPMGYNYLLAGRPSGLL